MYLKRLFFLWFILISSCITHKKASLSGVLIKSIRIKEIISEEEEYPEFIADVKTWYYDGYFIQAIPLIRTFDSANIHKWRVDTLFYTFLDLKARNYFRYSSFSDTAKMLQCCYTTTDSLGIEGGWDFFYKPLLSKKPEITYLADTILNGITYKRAISFRNKTLPDKQNISEPNQMYYFNLTRKDPTFTLNHYLTELTGYPVTRTDLFDTFKSNNVKFRWITQLQFEADSLTTVEKKVFKKWIENAKQNPVKYNAAKDSIYTPKF